MKTPVLESLFNKVVGLKACNFIKGRLQHRCFPVNNAKFLRTHFFTKHLQWLLLYLVWANIAPAYFLCNVVSALFGQHWQKQPFADVLKNNCFEKCLRFHFKTSVVEFLFNTVAGLKAHNFIKKKLRHRCFPLNTAKFLRTTFFTEHLWWLFLHCTGYCFVQSWPKQTKTKFCRLLFFKIIAVCFGPTLHK